MFRQLMEPMRQVTRDKEIALDVIQDNVLFFVLFFPEVWQISKNCQNHGNLKIVLRTGHNL